MKIWGKALIALAMSGACSLTFGQKSANADAINDYINAQHYATPTITKQIWAGFPKNAYRNGKPEGVVVHETANPNSTIYNEMAYMKNNYQNAFVHTFIDASNIINIANTNYLAWGSGPGGNARFVQFEQVEVHSKTAFAKELNNAAYYTAYILKQYGLTPSSATAKGGTVWSHHNVSNYLGYTDHTDPDAYWASNGQSFFGKSYTMSNFLELVKDKYAALGGSIEHEKPSTPAEKPKPTPTPSTHKYLVKYNHGYNNDTAVLANNYTNWTVYNHVKGTSGAKKIGWGKISADHRGAKVYVDSRGVKSDGWDGTWYRIRFSKNSKAKYWVYSNVLVFPKLTYKATNASMKLKTSANAPMYDHVRNSDYLARTLSTTNHFAWNKQIKVNMLGYINGETYSRAKINGTSYWIPSWGLTK